MEPITSGILVAVGTTVGAITGYLGKSREGDSKDKETLTKSQQIMTDQLNELHRQQNQLFSELIALTNEKKALELTVDELQEKVRSLKTALDRRDLRIQHLERELEGLRQ